MYSPHHTSLLVKRLTQVIVVLTLLITFLEPIVGLPLSTYFSLNQAFFSRSFFWQPLTSLFYLPETTFGFWSLLDFCFVIILFLVLAGQMMMTAGKRRFLLLYCGAAIASAAAAIVAMYCTHFAPPLSLLYPILLALVTAWTMSGNAQSVMIWMLFPLPPKWLLGLSLLVTIGNNLVHGNFVSTAAYTASFLFSYTVAIMVWYESSPFIALWPLEAALKRRSQAIRRFWNWKVMASIRKWRRTTTIE